MFENTSCDPNRKYACFAQWCNTSVKHNGDWFDIRWKVSTVVASASLSVVTHHLFIGSEKALRAFESLGPGGPSGEYCSH